MTAPSENAMETPHAAVRAAGCVLWRPGARDPEIALVHRPRYDDWSFPKGKLDPGESMPFAAVREVTEETGQSLRLGAVLGDVRYLVPEGPKLVRYWAAQACGGTFARNHETDELRWLAPEHVAQQLSYRHDLDVLHRFTSIGAPSSVLILVRHAKAGSRRQWDGADALRPLSGAGREQARQLGELLALFGPDRVASASPVRCRDTVAPLAAALGGVSIADEPLLGEDGYWDDPGAGLDRLRELAAVPGVTVVCSQGGVIPHVVGSFATGANLPGVESSEVPSRKASAWVLTFVDGGLRLADYYPRPTD
ncbi:MAG: NUDIX hydrolase [Pseudonocardia sp.]